MSKSKPHTISKEIEVDVPVRTAYGQWTQFESFPKFMEGIEEVRQLDDTHLYWVAKVGGLTRVWDAEITQQQPDNCIAWRSTDGETVNGAVFFSTLGPTRTKVRLEMAFHPNDPIEKVGDALGIVERRVQGDLERFKDFIENRGTETGAWRGTVEQGTRTR